MPGSPISQEEDKLKQNTQSRTRCFYLTLLTGPLRIQLWSQDRGSYIKTNWGRTRSEQKRKEKKADRRKYVSKFADQRTKWKETFLIKAKSDAIDTLKLFNQSLVIPTGLGLERLRGDRGTESTASGIPGILPSDRSQAGVRFHEHPPKNRGKRACRKNAGGAGALSSHGFRVA